VKEWPVPFWYVDTGMAALCMLLTAVDEGLGACLFGIQADQREGFRREFGVPEAYEPVGGITVGYRHPDLAPQDAVSVDARRRRQEDVVHRGHW
jgi:nitroreductase